MTISPTMKTKLLIPLVCKLFRCQAMYSRVYVYEKNEKVGRKDCY